MVVGNFGSNNVSVLLGQANEAFVEQMMLTTGHGFRPRSFAIGDFNNDDQMDIAVANSGTNNVGIFLGFGNSSFGNQTTYATGSKPYSVAVGDFNNDTRLDIVVANYGDNNVGVLLGDGSGSFSNQTTYSAGFGSSPSSVAVDDFNNDTLLDIIVANQGTSNVGLFRGYGNGTFASVIVFLMDYGSLPFSVVVGDFNNDRKLDFAIANNGTDNLKILLQTC
jgi:hypothetical protein